ncbi:MAG: DUF1365 domain-containing protein [Pseudomonadota bacterium]|nr:DUF1365 domain-containing protein [Pseudomonadota bacterium]
MASRPILADLRLDRLRQYWQQPIAEHLHLMYGHTLHHRRGKIQHQFVYPVFYLRLDLSQPLRSAGLFGYNRWRPIAFFEKDHGNGVQPLYAWFKDQLQLAGLADQFELGRLELTTQPRVFGYVFNPVSFWAAYDTAKQLRVVLCEVNNTFGVRLSYLLTAKNLAPIESKAVLAAYKQLHVSPFFAVRGRYQFQFDLNPTRQQVKIDYFATSSDQSTPDLATRVTVQATPATQAHLCASLTRYGFSTAMVVLRIHWQALKLWRKGARFHRSPEPPQQDLYYESTR